MNPIHGVSSSIPLGSPGIGKAASQGETSFKDALLDSIREVNSMQQDADRAVEALASGEDVQPAEVLTAVQKADIAFRLMMEMRNKIVEAYHEVQNIRV